MLKNKSAGRTGPGKAGRGDAKTRAAADVKQSRHKDLKQWLLAILISIGVVIVMAVVVGSMTRMNEGKDSPQDLAVSFIGAMEHQSRPELKKCLLSLDPHYHDITDTLMSYIESETGITSIEYNGIKMDVVNPDMITDMEESMSVRGIADTCIVYMEVPIVRTKDGGTYDTLTAYYLTAYKASEKWYIYDVVKDATYVNSGTDADGNAVDPDEAYRLFNNRFVGGDVDIGFIPLDDTWYALSEDDVKTSVEDAVKDVGYVQETRNAVIHMVLLDSEKSAKDLATQLAENLTADDTAAVEVMTMETELAGYTAYHTSFYSQDHDLFFFSWLIDTKEYDGNIRYLTLESTEDYMAASIYLTSYMTTEQYFTRGTDITDDTDAAESEQESGTPPEQVDDGTDQSK